MSYLYRPAYLQLALPLVQLPPNAMLLSIAAKLAATPFKLTGPRLMYALSVLLVVILLLMLVPAQSALLAQLALTLAPHHALRAMLELLPRSAPPIAVLVNLERKLCLYLPCW